MTYAEKMAQADALRDAALAEYGDAISKHRHDYDSPADDARCTCGAGADFRDRTRRGVGRHIAAEERKASKVYDEKTGGIYAAVFKATS